MFPGVLFQQSLTQITTAQVGRKLRLSSKTWLALVCDEHFTRQSTVKCFQQQFEVSNSNVTLLSCAD